MTNKAGSAQKSGGARTIDFELHGAYCGEHGTPSCLKARRITTKPFGFEMPH
jgi:hypothetical protein